jgi:signal transduction histidine kinase
MGWPSLLAASVAAASVMLAAIHLVIWWKRRSELANVAFAVLAVGVGLFAWSNDAMMRAATPERFIEALRWANVPIFVMVTGVIAFVHSRLRTGRAWLAHLSWIIRLVTLVANFISPTGMDYAAVSAMQQVRFLGGVVYVPVGVPSLWHWVGQVSLVLLGVFVVDASYSLWRTGAPDERRRALMIGIPMSLFVLGGAGWAALIFSGTVRWPHLEFVGFLGVAFAMSYELSTDVFRAAQLARDLQASEASLRDSEHRMTVAADAARLGLWMRDIPGEQVWMTDKCRELFGFPAGASPEYAAFAERIHPEDSARREAAIRRAVDTGAVYSTEYRVVLPGGSHRWIASQGRIDVNDGRPRRMLGVCIDITEQRHAELAARDLGGRLINAQEDERRRIARDLHDDLSQRLALMSVELDLLSRDVSGGASSRIVTTLASQVRSISSEIHKLSYQLHPAKLDQLGFVTAARSWCRDVAQQSGVPIEFAADCLPEDVSPDIALCLFRIIQEGLRNVVRHSGAGLARVELRADQHGLRLTIADDGQGFDPRAAAQTAGLGLVSMQERARLVHGTIDVQSQSGEGTSIVVGVPWPADQWSGAPRDCSMALPPSI